MKIGAFAKFYDLPISKVRYYVDIGLLLPVRVGSQLCFSDADQKDMALVLELKELSFSIEEIKSYLHVFRVYAASDRKINAALLSLLEKKILELKRDRSQIDACLSKLKQKASDLKQDIISKDLRLSGISLDFIPLIRCPVCGEPLNLDNAVIRNNSVISGAFGCCDNIIKIENGILISQADSETDYYSSDDFCILHYQEIPESNQDFVYFQYMNNITSETTALIAKSYSWLDSHLLKFDMRKKLIFIPDLSSHYLYKYANQPYFRDAYIIVSGFSKQNISAIKSHIDEVAPELKILYIANTIYRLPIQEKAIDVWIDTLSSYNFSFFHPYNLFEKIDRFIRPDAHLFGLIKYYHPNTQSRKNIDKAYNRHFPNHYSLPHFKQLLIDYNYDMHKGEEIGYSTNPGPYYEYHVIGEKQMYYVYHARKSKARIE